MLKNYFAIIIVLGCCIIACSSPDPLSFLEAAKAGDFEEVRRQINRGVDINFEDDAGFTALHFAAQNGFLDIVNLLIQKGANVHARTHNGYPIFQLKEIELRWPSRQSGATPLHIASKEHSDIVKVLIEAKADVNAFYAGSFTPLHIAAILDQQESVDALIKNGADVNARHWTGAVGTPLDMAEIYSSEAMA